MLKVPLSQLRAGFPILRSPANRSKAVPFTRDDFAYAFGNTMSREDSDRARQRYAVPGAGRVFFEGAFANVDPRSPARVDIGRDDRAPLLLMAGGSDHVVPASVVRANAGSTRSPGADRVRGVSRPIALHGRAGRLGGDRRLRAGLGAASGSPAP
ncbi:hypothetical protein NKG94_45835 [Micromonospora sp. M12]